MADHLDVATADRRRVRLADGSVVRRYLRRRKVYRGKGPPEVQVYVKAQDRIVVVERTEPYRMLGAAPGTPPITWREVDP